MLRDGGGKSSPADRDIHTVSVQSSLSIISAKPCKAHYTLGHFDLGDINKTEGLFLHAEVSIMFVLKQRLLCSHPGSHPTAHQCY